MLHARGFGAAARGGATVAAPHPRDARRGRFGGKGRALEALRRMAAGRMGEDKGDAEAIAQVTGDAATLRAVLHGLAKEG